MQIDIAGSEVKNVPATHELDVEQSKHDVADVSETSTDNSINNKLNRSLIASMRAHVLTLKKHS